jgi:hypothetical protein
MNREEKKLIHAYRALDIAARQSLQDFADFLATREAAEIEPLAEPVLTPAKEGETVVGALKRLAAAYPMLDKAKMLDETSTLVTQNVMQGRDKLEVIADLEQVFSSHYQRLKAERNEQS